MVLVVRKGKWALSNSCNITQLLLWRSKNEVREKRITHFRLTRWPYNPVPAIYFAFANLMFHFFLLQLPKTLKKKTVTKQNKTSCVGRWGVPFRSLTLTCNFLRFYEKNKHSNVTWKHDELLWLDNNNLSSWSNWTLDLKGAIDIIYFNLLILQLRKPKPPKIK